MEATGNCRGDGFTGGIEVTEVNEELPFRLAAEGGYITTVGHAAHADNRNGNLR